MNANDFINILKENKFTHYETVIKDSSMKELSLYGILNNGRMYYVVVYTDMEDGKLNAYNFQNYMAEIRNCYGTKNVLFVIFSYGAEAVKEELGALYGYWIYDKTNNRTMIFDDQPQSFINIEELLETEIEKPSKDNVIRLKLHESVANYIIILANVIVFIIMALKGNTENAYFLSEHGGLVPYMITNGHEYYRFFTSIFLHAGIKHIIGNMIVLLFVGEQVERVMGTWRYLIIYFLSGLAGGIVSIIWYGYVGESSLICMVGASGAIFGVTGALLYLIIINKGRLADISITRIMLYIALSIYVGFQSKTTGNAAHIGGFVAGLLLALICYRKRGKE